MDKIRFLKSLIINDSNMEEITNIHPRQLFSTEIPIPIWKIEYSYVTARNNSKTAVKYTILDESAWDMVENEFFNHVREMNEKFPERKISNVQILDVEFLGNASLSLE